MSKERRVYKSHEYEESISTGSEEGENEGKSTTFLATCNVLKLAIGASIVAVPNKFCGTGYVLGITSLMFFGYLGHVSSLLIINVKRKTGCLTLDELCQNILGPAGFWTLNIAVCVLLFLLIPLYGIIEFNFCAPFLQLVGAGSWTIKDSVEEKIWLGILSVALTPLLCLSDLTVLGFTSATGISCSILLIIITLIAVPLEESHDKWTPNTSPHGGFIDLMLSFGVYASAFFCHHGICQIHSSLNDPSKWELISRISFAVIFLSNAIMALMVYFEFGAYVCFGNESFFFQYFTSKSGETGLYLMAIGATLQSISVIFSLPLIHFILRELNYNIIKSIYNMHVSVDKQLGSKIPNWFFYGHIIIWFAGFLVGIVKPSAIDLIDFIGVFCIPLLCYCIPSLLHMQLNGGIVHYLSFGISKPRAYYIDSNTKRVILTSVKSSYDHNTLDSEKKNWLSKIFYIVICNFMFYWGSSQVVISFFVLARMFF